MTAYCTTIMLINGPPGYCDVDYEYMYTNTPPLVDEQLAFTEKHCQIFICSKYQNPHKGLLQGFSSTSFLNVMLAAKSHRQFGSLGVY
jgi:hypothetical protein